MRKFIATVMLIATFSYAEKIIPKYSNSTFCMPCHKRIVKDWRTSLHAKSHYSKNELYKKLLETVAKKRHKRLAFIEAKCAQCHNPHMHTKKDPFELALEIRPKRLKNANASYLVDGVNCIVCHNIEKIEESKDPRNRGRKSVVWGPNDTMIGPFDDAISPYHKTKKASFFKENPNKLCFVCHYNEKNYHGLMITTTGKEYESVKGDKKSCVECHMGPLHPAHAVQANLASDTTANKVRILRSHFFAGVRNSDIVSKAIKVDAALNGKYLSLSLENLVPHKVPTAFGGREIEIRVKFFKDEKVLSKTSYILGTKYVDSNKEETYPYLAKKIAKDSRLKPFEKRRLRVEIPADTTKIEVVTIYRLTPKSWIKKLNLTQKEFLKDYIVNKKVIKF